MHIILFHILLVALFLLTASFLIQNPSWNQSFTFNIANEHNYLNICVWSRVTDESCDLLIGHVSQCVYMCVYVWPRMQPTKYMYTTFILNI